MGFSIVCQGKVAKSVTNIALTAKWRPILSASPEKCTWLVLKDAR